MARRARAVHWALVNVATGAGSQTWFPKLSLVLRGAAYIEAFAGPRRRASGRGDLDDERPPASGAPRRNATQHQGGGPAGLAGGRILSVSGGRRSSGQPNSGGEQVGSDVRVARSGGPRQRGPDRIDDLVLHELLLTTLDAMVEATEGPTPSLRRGEVRAELPWWLRALVFTRDGWTCQWCRCQHQAATSDWDPPWRVTLDADHLIPWSLGGSDDTDNLRALCAACNQKRSNAVADAHVVRLRPISWACVSCFPSRILETIGDPAGHRPAWCVRCRTAAPTADALIVRPPYQQVPEAWDGRRIRAEALAAVLGRDWRFFAHGPAGGHPDGYSASGDDLWSADQDPWTFGWNP